MLILKSLIDQIKGKILKSDLVKARTKKGVWVWLSLLVYMVPYWAYVQVLYIKWVKYTL
jgi:hypothetical protein